MFNLASTSKSGKSFLLTFLRKFIRKFLLKEIQLVGNIVGHIEYFIFLFLKLNWARPCIGMSNTQLSFLLFLKNWSIFTSFSFLKKSSPSNRQIMFPFDFLKLCIMPLTWFRALDFFFLFNLFVIYFTFLNFLIILIESSVEQSSKSIIS